MRVCIGIPLYSSAPSETVEDLMRWTYHLGRRMPEHEFFLAIKPKSEQFRARNAIVQAAAQFGCDFLFMLDDDHVIGWQENQGPSNQYDFLRTLLGHMEDPKVGVVGALYYHRGGDCLPVLMKEGKDGGYYYMRDDEITHGLQEVAVTGGGAMLCRMEAMMKLEQPIFEPEFKYGTDLQVCQKMRDAGYKVVCDTSVVLGHVLQKREIVTPENRFRIMAESNTSHPKEGQFDPNWAASSAYHLYFLDATEYLGISTPEAVEALASLYEKGVLDFPGKDGDLETYYKTRGAPQLARQVWFHGSSIGIHNDSVVRSLFKSAAPGLRVLDFGCGSAPVGFDLAMNGHHLDFVDLDGSYAYEFTKWRAKKREVECGWSLGGPYDVILCLDSLEHLKDPAATVKELVSRLKENGCFFTNYFDLRDVNNVEHCSMDREAVKEALLSAGIYPVQSCLWIKRDLGFMDRKAA